MKNIFDGSNFSAFKGLDANKVNYNLNRVKAHWKGLQGRNNTIIDKFIEDKGKGVYKAQHKYLNYTKEGKSKIEPVRNLEAIPVPEITFGILIVWLK